MIHKNDIKVLQDLAKMKAEIASHPVNKENIKLWRGVNDLSTEKAAIYIDEIPWHEMDCGNELKLLTKDKFYQEVEQKLRREIYCWRHMPGNMVVTPSIDCPIVIIDSGFGIEEISDIVTVDDKTDTPSRHFHIQIRGIDDIEKIKDPVISIDEKKTAENYEKMKEVFDGILDVRKVGQKGMWFTPWDNLVRWTGVQEALMDLVMQPEYIDKLVERYVDASMARLDKYEELGIWASNNDNTRVGSGGYGYCSDLDSADEHLCEAPLKQMWGCGNAQIFSSVSPQMHWDFSLKHEMRWLERFGHTYYGCCEPLSGKFDILEKIPNLQKVSMSPWADISVSAERAKGKYVLSCKPNPAIFVTDTFDVEHAKKEIFDILENAKGCAVELIMKDISTVKYDPERLWRWAEIAKETIDEFYG